MAYYRFTAAILEGKAIEVFGDGTQRRDFTYIDDIVAGVIAALDRPPLSDSKSDAAQPPHRLYNLGNDRPNTLNRLIELVEATCNRKAERAVLPVQPADVPATWADISASRRELGFSPLTPLEDGLPRFVDWYRKYAGV
jgi:UDP-glucuronate 4-epimerase